MRRDRWNTYATYGYSFDAAGDQCSAGGVHHYQVKRLKSGGWVRSILQSNGVHSARGAIEAVEDREGEVLWERVKAYCEDW